MGEDASGATDLPGLDGALREGFRGDREPPESVVEALSRQGGRDLSLRLRNLTGLDEGAHGSRSTAHYTLAGEIGRGGVGVVLRGTDVDLGREVAVKVLRSEYVDHPQVVSRFVEEAQIEGQLEHPGIVPVYELATDLEGRPFFAMKLVQGKTLGLLLAERASPDEDRRRFLTIFEQVCQAIAYAHARGVVHRDLKPENVMVGAFGEVQVVDWGLAKVLGHEAGAAAPVETVRTRTPGTESRLGTALGTPCYMPPEQARGEVKEVDERSDVFALGAILLEILTGAPPYPKGAPDALARAARADLADATARLESSRAEADLVGLCRDCLAPAPGARPRDAGVVAARVVAHLAAVEERAWRAQLAAAQAAARAEQERRARRLTLALALAVLLALSLGGGGYLWIQADRRAREEAAERAVRGAVAQAREQVGAARQAAVGALPLWESARAEARRAADLAQTAGAGSEVRDLAVGLLAEVDGQLGRARAAAERAARDAATVRRLERVLLVGSEASGLQASERDLAAAFRGQGIDVDALATDTAAARVRASAIRAALVAALDRWTWVRTRLGGPAGEGADRLRRLAQAADPQDARVAIRRLASAGDRQALLDAAAGADGSDADTALLLAVALQGLGEHEAAVALLRRAGRRHPDDVWVAFHLGRALTLEAPPAWAEAAASYRVALALRPDSVALRHRLCFALERAGRGAEALALWWDVLPHDDEPVVVYQHIVHLHEQAGTLDALLDELAARAEADPHDPHPHLARGLVHMVRGAWTEAAQACEEATRVAPQDRGAWLGLGDALAFGEHPDRAVGAYEHALQVDPGFARARWRLGGVKVLLGDLPGAAAEMERATQLDPTDAGYWAAWGQCLRLAGDPERGLPLVEWAVGLEPDAYSIVDELAWNHFERGEMDAALEAARRAQGLSALEPEGRFGLSFTKELDRSTGRVVRKAVLGWETSPETAHYVAAFALECRGDLADALAEVEQGARYAPEAWYPAYVRGHLLRRLGAFEEAAEALGVAGERNPAYPWTEYERGFALLGAGRVDEARGPLGRFRETGPWLEGAGATPADWEAHVEVLQGLARAWAAGAPGGAVPAASRERVLLAWLLSEVGRPGAAVRLVQAWLAEDPGIAEEPMPWPGPERLRFLAALTAVEAASGFDLAEGSPDPAVAAQLRDLGRRWLEEDWDGWSTRLAAGDRLAALHLSHAADVRLGNPRLALVRAASNLRRLPAEEATAWKALWERIRADRVRAEAALAPAR